MINRYRTYDINIFSQVFEPVQKSEDAHLYMRTLEYENYMLNALVKSD